MKPEFKNPRTKEFFQGFKRENFCTASGSALSEAANRLSRNMLSQRAGDALGTPPSSSDSGMTFTDKAGQSKDLRHQNIHQLMAALANINNWDPAYDNNFIVFANQKTDALPMRLRIAKPKIQLTEKMKTFYEMYKQMNEMPEIPNHKNHDA
ncbi:unnamed protein product [Oikopleura dioica]|uniref:Uncharacterized protein n=1 Tax=Oikopleura dioica TaxID=34765 RepID=E4XEB2_OIKDI|nr:unnamed protein product [Oikopleura dioica]